MSRDVMFDEAETNGLLAFEARLLALGEKLRAGFPERASELRSAVLALPIEEATARESLRRYAHKLRGTAGSHGFAHLSELAANLERLALHGEPAAVALEARALADALDREPAPAAPVCPQVTAEPTSEVLARAKTLAGLRIAAVDDDASTRRLLTLTLGNVGRAEVVVEERAASLIDRLREERFDVVIVDAMMPEMNGRACLENIVIAGLHHDGTRYFVLSAATALELSWSLPEALGVAWLRKPFRPRELVDAIAAELGR